jgi:hypothetical protein
LEDGSLGGGETLATSMDQTLDELSRFEKEYKFCNYKEIPTFIQLSQPHIVSMTKNEQGMTQLRIFNYESSGVEFSIGTLYREVVEGIWGNLNLELLYLTSDDDERFSIQVSRYLYYLHI